MSQFMCLPGRPTVFGPIHKTSEHTIQNVLLYTCNEEFCVSMEGFLHRIHSQTHLYTYIIYVDYILGEKELNAKIMLVGYTA